MANVSTQVEDQKNQVRSQEDDIKRLKSQLEKSENASKQNRADASVQIEDLRSDIKTLRGELDKLTHDLEISQKENTKIRQDFDLRLLELEKKSFTTSHAPQPEAKEVSKSIPNKDDSSSYQFIIEEMQKTKDYTRGVSKLRDFLTTYPKSTYAANAQYWIGDAFYAQRDFKRSIKELELVTKNYPNNPKACDALLKQGYGFKELKQPNEASLFFEEVTSKCPNTESAAKARAAMQVKTKNIAAKTSKKK